MSDKIPVTVLTGFLGSGKTTLLNRILAENHGQRIAVIENEFGEIGVDQDLVINADEEIFEMNNGCICCTVRGDLVRILAQLRERRERFDRIVLETTGLANPGPVAQTFFIEKSVADHFALDGIVTLVDTAHIDLHLDDNEEAREQIAFADVIVLNKLDLVESQKAAAVERRIRAMNAMARLVRSERAEVAMNTVLGLGGFDLARALEYKPTFLEPEYPFEWIAAYALEAGRYEMVLREGPDPTMKILFCRAEAREQDDEAGLLAAAERVTNCFRGDAPHRRPGSVIEARQGAWTLDLSSAGQSRFTLNARTNGVFWLCTQHTPEEFHLELQDEQGDARLPQVSRGFDAGHTHDEAVSSFSIETDQPLHFGRFREWLGRELSISGANIYRMKGFLNFKGSNERIVIQGVHMLADTASLGSWGSRPRRTQLVFIGKALDAQAMREGFQACLA
jgi:G3E family GTPase